MSNTATKPQAATSSKPTLPPGAPLSAALAMLQNGKWTAEDFSAWDATRMAAKNNAELSVKHRTEPDANGNAPTGAVCVYGLNGKWPVSLYPDQWARLFAYREQVEAYIAEHRETLDALSAASKAAKKAAKK